MNQVPFIVIISIITCLLAWAIAKDVDQQMQVCTAKGGDLVTYQGRDVCAKVEIIK